MLQFKDKLGKSYTEKHYGAIDGLRAFSAIGIVLMHVLANREYQLNGFVFEQFIPSLTNLVFLFMIISAFSMCCGYYHKIAEGQLSVEQFYKKRYTKVWPFFALLCVLDLIMAPSLTSLYEVFANLTLCFGLLPNANISVIGVGWFLGVVFVFYLIFPYFCFLISNKKRAWFSFFVALLFNLLCSKYFEIGRGNFIFCAAFFLAGGLIFIYREQLYQFAAKYWWLVLLMCIALACGYYLLGASVPIMIIMHSLFLIYAIGVTKKGVLQNPFTHLISDISLEIYLSHMVVYRVIERFEIFAWLQNEVFIYICTVLATLLGTVVFAVSFRWGFKKITEVIRLVIKTR